MEEYKYDVAFSFLSEDEKIAFNLYSLLKDRLKCFIYSEEQKRIAGKDGELEFNEVFSKDARVVVVLYREKWGKTSWTRIEETAIRNKAHENGYDFVLFIPLDKSPAPIWLPKTRLRIGLTRWGIESAAAIIEARASEFGANINEESIADKFAKDENEQIKKREIKSLIESEEGLSLALKEAKTLKELFENQVSDINSKLSNSIVSFKQNRQRFDLFQINSYGITLNFEWGQRWANSASDFSLRVDIYDEKSEIVKEFHLRFDINSFDEKGWSNFDTKEDFLTSSKLVQKSFKIFYSEVARLRKERNY